MQLPDLEFYHWLAIGGGAVALLAILAQIFLRGRLKIPAVLAGILAGLAAGAGLGILWMVGFGYKAPYSDGASPPPAEGKGGPPGGMMMGGGMGGMGGMGGGRGGMGGGMRGPTPKAQLATLVSKLDQLTDKPLTVHFTEEQRTKVREQLRGLDADDLSDDTAQQKLDAVLAVLKDQKETLEAAGYNWPGQGGGRGMRAPPVNAPPPNPFRDEHNSQHLRSLRQRLGEAGA